MKKIIAIISACLVTILLTVTIVLACTKFTAATVVKYDKVWSMDVYNSYHDSEDPMVLTTDDNEYKEILKLYQASLKENNLASLFQGAKGFDEEVKNEEVSVKTIIDNSEGTLVFRLNYSETQTLALHGKDYVNEESSTKETVKFDSLLVEVKNTANYTEYNVYLVEGDATYSSWNVSLIAQQEDLYAYITNLKYQF